MEYEDKNMKKNKTMKKAISLALAATLAVSLLAPWGGTQSANVAEAAEESSKTLDLTQYLNIYDNFDSYETGSTYTLDGPDSYGSAATASIETKDGSDRWLKLSGNNGVGHMYAQNGWARDNFSGAISAYNGVAVYVKTESAATFNLQMIGYGGRTRTATNGDLDYTLVSAKNGKVTIAKGGGGVPLAAGFEGWIIIGYEELTAAGGYDSAFVAIQKVYDDLKWVNLMAAEITGASGAVYVDNMSFVKDCSTFISALEEALAPPPSVYDYLNLYEDFEGFDLGTNTYLTASNYGSASASEVVESDITGNKWLKINAENYGWHVYADDNYARNNFSGKISKHDGVALYVHTDASATLNLTFTGAEGRTRTATNGDLDYTLVSKNGVKTVAKGNCGVSLAAGFEGWIIIGYEELTPAGGYTEALAWIKSIAGWNENLGFVNRMGVEITNTTEPVYVDNISFVTSTADMINFLAPEVPSADDYLVVYEDFEGFASGDSYSMDYREADGGASVAVATIATKSAGNLWLKLSGNNRAGHIYTKPRTEFSLSKDACQGVAVDVKATKAATFNVLLRGGGLTRTNNNPDLDYTLIASDGATTSAKGTYGIPLKAGYEGWVLIEKAELTAAAGGWQGVFDVVSDMNEIDVFTFEITDTTGPVYVDNLSFVTNMNALKDMLRVTYPSDYVKYYEDFNGYAEGKGTYALNDGGNEYFEEVNQTNATATIEARGEEDRWLKLSGNNNVGHIYGTNEAGEPTYGWPRTDFSADSTEYQGVSLYVKTEFAATLNLRLRIAYSNRSRTATNDSLTYTLIPKDGEATTKTEANGISLPAGFEGTVVLKNDAFTAAASWCTPVHDYLAAADNKDLNQLNEFAAEITNTEGIVYLDNYAFVTDVDAYIASFANVSKTYGTGDLNKDHTVGDYDAMLERKFLVTNDAKMLQLDGNNGAGVALPSGENAKNPSGLSYDGFAVKLQSDSEVKLNLVLRYAYGGASGQYRTGFVSKAHDEKEVTYTLVSKHGSKLEKTTNGGMIIPANFDGWLVFGKEEMGINGGWDASPEFASTDVTGFTYLFPWITGVTDAVDFRNGSFAFATNKEGLVNALVAGTSYGSYLGVVEDFENKNYGTYTFDSASIDGQTANAAIVASGVNTVKEYDVRQDDVVDSRDLVRIKRLAVEGIEETPIVFDASELLANAAVWNTPGLAENKDFQFDIESTSTWSSVTGDEAQYLASLTHHNVGETTSLLPSVKAGEWGYALTHLNGEVDGAGNTIDNLGYTSTAKPTTDAEALAKMKEFIQTQWSITDSTDWHSLNGYYPWYHYAAEFGAKVISTEIGEAQNNYQMHTAFARGAGRQYGKAWGIDFSMWHDGYMYNPNDYSGWYMGDPANGGYYTDKLSGHSMSLLERSLVMGYMSGANSLVAEAGGAMSLSKNDADGDGYLDLTDYGKTVNKVYQFTENTDVGTAYTPVGIVLDYNHGSYAGITADKDLTWWEKLLGMTNETEAENAFYTFGYTAGDQMTKNLAKMIWGTDAWISGPKRESKEEADAMVNNGEYGDSFDILLQNASLDVLKSYPVLLLSGDITLSSDEVQLYKQYVNDGGTLLLNRAYMNAFEVFTGTMPYGDGRVIVYGDSAYDLTGLDAILKEQIAKYQPVKVDGNIQYMTSVKDNTIYVALINNEGVTKTGSAAATTDTSKASGVTVTYTGNCSVASATDVYNHIDVSLSGKAATVTVPAGGIAVLEFKLR